MKITTDRLKHSLAVAEKMEEIVKKKQNIYSCSSEEAFVLGLVHDIGYNFCVNQKDHAKKGGHVLKEQGYKYWQEVFYHGSVQDTYDSSLLKLLNYVDMTTGPSGDYMTIQARIDDIAVRYGKDSIQVQDAELLASRLMKNNPSD